MASKSYGIHDKWIDINKINNVDIKSVDGVIESVKINGEEAGGGGDLTRANVTIVSTTQGRVGTMHYGMMSPYYAYTAQVFASKGSSALPIILYQGQIFLTTDDGTATVTIASTSGAITYDSEASMYIITGDCTITIS